MAQGREPAAEADLLAVLRPCPDEWLKIWPVDRKVGHVKNTGLQPIKPDHVFVAIADLSIKAIEVRGVQLLPLKIFVVAFPSSTAAHAASSSTQLVRAFLSDSAAFNASSIACRCARHSFKPGG
jgi:hypothetical protein